MTETESLREKASGELSDAVDSLYRAKNRLSELAKTHAALSPKYRDGCQLLMEIEAIATVVTSMLIRSLNL